MSDRLDRAHEQHEHYALPEIEQWFTGIPRTYVLTERRKNFRKSMKDAPIVGEIVRAKVNETADTHNQVISLLDADGRSYSLWLTADGNVSGVTPY